MAEIILNTGLLPVRDPIFMKNFIKTEHKHPDTHRASAFPSNQLLQIEAFLPEKVNSSLETGCGKSTILFSNLSDNHQVYALDDRNFEDSSVNFYEQHPLTKNKNINFHPGPTQISLFNEPPQEELEVVLLDGPHGYPFPEIEYWNIYPKVKKGGLLIVDDVTIPTVARLADFLFEDDMWDFAALVNWTAIFIRTHTDTTPPHGDSWWEQKYNQSRRTSSNKFFIETPTSNFFSNFQISGMSLDKYIHDFR